MRDKKRDDSSTIIEGFSNDTRNMLYTAQKAMGGDPSDLFDVIYMAIINEDWKEMVDKDGKPLTGIWQLLTAPLPTGAGMSRQKIKALLQIPHRNEGGKRWDERMRIVRETLDSDMPALNKNGGDRVSESSLTCQTGDKTKGGNSRDYTIAKLKRDAPALAQKVITGELTAAEAMREYRVSIGKPARPNGYISFIDASKAVDTLMTHMDSATLAEFNRLFNDAMEGDS